MYRKILVALDNTATDIAVVEHIVELARLCHSELLLVHVADGFAARHYHQLNMAESEEMRDDRAYLDRVAVQMRGSGLTVNTHLAMGDPSTELLKMLAAEECDLIALTTHGHKLLGDIVHGSTIDKVRHNTSVPLLVVRAKKPA
jgi:nucleotide-binding universal stress UspA family protein